MKTIKQKFAVMATLMAMLLCGCAQNQLRKSVDEFNKKCPVQIAMFARIMEATFDNDHVAIRYELDDRLMKIEAMRENADLVKQQLLDAYCQPKSDMKEFVDVILAADATLEFIYEGRLSGEKTSVTITPEELRKAKDGERMSADDQLAFTILMCNAQCPITLADGMVMTSMQQEGESVYYLYDVSPEIFANLQENLDNAKAATRSSLERLGEVEKMDLRKVPAANKSLGYRYTCPDTGESVEFSFTQSQLNDILK